MILLDFSAQPFVFIDRFYGICNTFPLNDSVVHFKQSYYHPTQEFHQPTNIAEPAATWDSSRPIVIGQARWSRGQDVCTSKQEIMGSNPARVACEVFSTDTRKALSIQCYTHVGVGQNLITRRKNFINVCVHICNFIHLGVVMHFYKIVYGYPSIQRFQVSGSQNNLKCAA